MPLVLALLLAACGGAADDDAVGGMAIDRGDGAQEPAEPPRRPGDTAGDGDDAAAPGDVVAVRPFGAEALPAGANGWQVIYLSASESGELVEVSGVIYAPDADPPDGGRPVLSWGHAPTGVADACTPSAVGEPIPYLEELLAAGYVVAATDYEGLGGPGPHPFLVGASGARSMLDIVRAAVEMENVTAAGTRVVTFGQFQGGQASLFAAAIAPAYAPELELVTAVAGAPPTDLTVAAVSAATQPALFGYFALTAHGFAAAYPELALDDLLTAEGVETLKVVDDACVDEVIAAFADTDVTPLIAVPPTENPAWMARIRENSLGDLPDEVPVLIVQGSEDEILNPVLVELAVERMCGNGDRVRHLESEGASHDDVLAAEQNEVLGWIGGAMAGEPLDTSC